MPTKAMRFCAKCRAMAVSGGLCEIHRKAADKQAADRQEHQWQSMYQTSTWRAMRLAQLAKEPLCQECMKEHRLTPATVADHAVVHRGNPALFYDPDNLQSMCASCHSSKTDREDAGFGNPIKKT